MRPDISSITPSLSFPSFSRDLRFPSDKVAATKAESDRPGRINYSLFTSGSGGKTLRGWRVKNTAVVKAEGAALISHLWSLKGGGNDDCKTSVSRTIARIK